MQVCDIYVLVHLERLCELDDADVVGEDEGVVGGVHGQLDELHPLLGAVVGVVVEVVLAGHDGQVGGHEAEAAVGGGQHVGLVQDGPAAGVEPP